MEINKWFRFRSNCLTEEVCESSRFFYVNMATLIKLKLNIPSILCFPPEEDEIVPTIFIRPEKGWLKDSERIVNSDKFKGQPARPFNINIDEEWLFAIWCQIEKYEASPYTEWSSEIIGVIFKKH